MKHKNSKIIKIQIKPKFGASYSSIDAPIMERLSDYIFSNKVVVKAPAQWLEPFKFQKNEPATINSTSIHAPNETKQALPLATNFTQVTLYPSSTVKPNKTNIYVNSVERSLAKLNQTFISISTTKVLSLSASPIASLKALKSDKLNINDYLNCEQNLTRLTVFYSSMDTLKCFETLRNASLLKCFDDLLENKLVTKLGTFYYLKLQPLLIPRSKTICEPRASNSTTRTFQDPSPVPFSSTLANKLTTDKLVTSIYFNENEKETFLSETKFVDSLNCTLQTKKSTNRKKLVWKLYLLLKNQTCIPMEPFRTAYTKEYLVKDKPAARNNNLNLSRVESDEITNANSQSNSSIGDLFLFFEDVLLILFVKKKTKRKIFIGRA